MGSKNGVIAIKEPRNGIKTGKNLKKYDRVRVMKNFTQIILYGM